MAACYETAKTNLLGESNCVVLPKNHENTHHQQWDSGHTLN